jgi:hypothetical protein
LDRVQAAANVIKKIRPASLLDVGCRNGVLRSHIDTCIAYSGCDLVAAPHVQYAGDILKVDISDRFDCVVALDVLEHVDEIHVLFDRLVELSRRHVVVSLPNCYDAKSRYRFAVQGQLGGKYRFGLENTLDRHRWVMSYGEIHAFYRHVALKHELEMSTVDLQYGSPGRNSLTSILGKASRLLGRSLTSESILGVFSKRLTA